MPPPPHKPCPATVLGEYDPGAKLRLKVDRGSTPGGKATPEGTEYVFDHRGPDGSMFYRRNARVPQSVPSRPRTASGAASRSGQSPRQLRAKAEHMRRMTPR